jgi:hypothetical protein
MSEQMPEQTPEWSWIARFFGLIDIRNKCFLGSGAEAGICLEYDKHAGEP